MSYRDDDGVWDSDHNFYPDKGKEHMNRESQVHDYEHGHGKHREPVYSRSSSSGDNDPMNLLVWIFILWLIFGN